MGGHKLLPWTLRNRLFQIGGTQTSTIESPQHTVWLFGNSNVFLSTMESPQQILLFQIRGTQTFFFLPLIFRNKLFQIGRELKLFPWSVRKKTVSNWGNSNWYNGVSKNKLFQFGGTQTSTIESPQKTVSKSRNSNFYHADSATNCLTLGNSNFYHSCTESPQQTVLNWGN